MKGYELVLYANAIVFLGLSFFALTYGIMLTHQSDLCPERTATCERQADLGASALRVAPFLAAIGTLLAGVAATLTLRRVKLVPRPPVEDNV